MNEEIFEKLEQLLSENERKLDNLIEAQRERKTVSETKKEAEKDNFPEINIKKVIDQLDI